MATSAPSVPAAPATSAAPTGTPAAPQEATPKKIAPIPPKAKAGTADTTPPDTVVHKEPPSHEPDDRPRRTSLPGVVTGEGAPELPVRGPDGRFISQEEAARLFNADLDGESDDGVRIEGDEPAPKATPEEPPKKPELPGQGGKVMFLGKEYANLAAVEQMYRSLQGMHDPIAKKLAQAEKDRDYGYDAANRWQQEAEAAKAKLVEYEKGRQPATSAGTEQKQGLDLEALVDGINYDAFETIAHDPKGGTRVAGRYLASQILNAVASQIVPALRAELMKEISPVRDTLQTSQQEAATANRVAQVLDQVAAMQTMDGKPAFPELLDAEMLHEIGATWRESGLPPEAAMSPQGLINAIGLYRLMKSLPDGTTPAAEPGPVLPGPEITALADGSEGAHTGLGRTPEPSHLGPEARALRRGLDETPIFDRTLGFAVNRRR
jgi:hypothetical protein